MAYFRYLLPCSNTDKDAAYPPAITIHEDYDATGLKKLRLRGRKYRTPRGCVSCSGRVLETKAVVAKRREVFLAGRTRIHLDEVDGLGTFMELEVMLAEDETDSDGERIASALMEQLGVRQEDLVEQAYVELPETTDSQ